MRIEEAVVFLLSTEGRGMMTEDLAREMGNDIMDMKTVV